MPLFDWLFHRKKVPAQKDARWESVRAEPLGVTSSRRIDEDERIQTPKGAELTYLDSRALKFWNGKRTDHKVPPYYEESAFGRNAGPALERLLAGGYLQVSALEGNISLKTVPELKEILSAHKLKVSGKKSDLVRRLMDSLPEQELKRLFPVGVYIITEKGERARKPYSIVERSDEHGLGFSYYRLLQEREKAAPQDSDDVILTRLLTEEIQDCYKSGNRAGFQIAVTKAGRFMDEIGETECAFECYILGFFVYAMDIKEHPVLNRGGQSCYLASLVEHCGRNEGCSLEQVVAKIRAVLKESQPFGLAVPANINFAISLFKKSLSV